MKDAIQARERERVVARILESLERKSFDKDVETGRASRGMSQVGG